MTVIQRDETDRRLKLRLPGMFALADHQRDSGKWRVTVVCRDTCGPSDGDTYHDTKEEAIAALYRRAMASYPAVVANRAEGVAAARRALAEAEQIRDLLARETGLGARAGMGGA